MSILMILLIVTMLAVVGVLVTGIVAMNRGGEFNRKYGNKLMRARVVLQGVAIALAILLIWTKPRS